MTIYNVNYNADGLNVGKNVGLKRADQILNFIKENSTITADEMATIFNMTERTIDKDLSSLKKQNKLKRIGSKKSGYWETL